MARFAPATSCALGAAAGGHGTEVLPLAKRRVSHYVISMTDRPMPAPVAAGAPSCENPRPARRLLLSVVIHVMVAGIAAVAVAWVLVGRGVLAPAYLPGVLAVYALVGGAALLRLDAHAPSRHFGPANQVTLARGTLSSLVAGTIAVAPSLTPGQLWVLSAAAAAALLLDGVDGWLARRTAMASRYGAAFDANLDTIVMASLAVLVWRLGDAGAWVLATGALLPGFLLAGLAVPALAAPLPFSRRRRAVCVVQIGTLVACLTPWVASPVSDVAAAGALGLLILSFGLDTVWLIRSAGDGARRQSGRGS